MTDVKVVVKLGRLAGRQERKLGYSDMYGLHEGK
jgi:hypothetical protein